MADCCNCGFDLDGESVDHMGILQRHAHPHRCAELLGHLIATLRAENEGLKAKTVTVSTNSEAVLTACLDRQQAERIEIEIERDQLKARNERLVEYVRFLESEVSSAGNFLSLHGFPVGWDTVRKGAELRKACGLSKDGDDEILSRKS